MSHTVPRFMHVVPAATSAHMVATEQCLTQATTAFWASSSEFIINTMGCMLGKLQGRRHLATRHHVVRVDPLLGLAPARCLEAAHLEEMGRV